MHLAALRGKRYSATIARYLKFDTRWCCTVANVPANEIPKTSYQSTRSTIRTPGYLQVKPVRGVTRFGVKTSV